MAGVFKSDKTRQNFTWKIILSFIWLVPLYKWPFNTDRRKYKQAAQYRFDCSSKLKNIQTFLSLRRACDLVQAHIEKTCSNNYVRRYFDVVDSVAQW